MIVDQLVALLGIEVDSAKLQKADTALNKVKANFFSIKTAALAATVGIFEFERRMTRGIAEIGQTSRLLGISAQDFQVLEYAAKKSGVAFSSVTGAISKLNDQLAEGSSGKPPVELLQNLAQLSQASGVKVDPFKANRQGFKEGYQLLQEILPAFEKLNKQQQLAFSNRIFGSNILPAFAKLKEAREELKGNNLLLSNKDIAQMEKLNSQFLLFSKNIEVLFKKVAVALMPFFEILTSELNKNLPKIEEVAKAFAQWLVDPKTLESIKSLAESLRSIGSILSTIVEIFSTTFGTVGRGIGNAAGFLATSYEKLKDKGTSLFSPPSLNNINQSTKPEASQKTENTTNNNDNRSTNTTVYNNIIPSNMQSIYMTGVVR